jgi:hypothetical protein
LVHVCSKFPVPSIYGELRAPTGILAKRYLGTILQERVRCATERAPGLGLLTKYSQAVSAKLVIPLGRYDGCGGNKMKAMYISYLAMVIVPLE